jgi:TolA-binding protein
VDLVREGGFDDAAAHFEKSVQPYPRTSVGCALALSYLEGERFAEAVDTFNRFLERYDYSRAVQPILAATMHYWTGVAYESADSNDRAVEQYQEFLTIWQDADPGLQIVTDAKRRLERLHQGS